MPPKRQAKTPKSKDSSAESSAEEAPCSSSQKSGMPRVRANSTPCPYCHKSFNTSASYSNLNKHMKKCAPAHKHLHVAWTSKAAASPETKAAQKKAYYYVYIW